MTPHLRRPAPPTRVRPAVVRTVVGVVLLLALAGCGGTSGDSTAAQAAPARSGDFRSGAPGSALDKTASGESAMSEPPAQAPAADGRQAAQVKTVVPTAAQLARRAEMTIRVKDVTSAAADVRGIALTAGGVVTSENLSAQVSSPDQPAADAVTRSGTVTISVPGSSLDATLDRLGKLGTVLNRASSSEDVGAQVVDTTARLATMRESVARVRALMSQATKLSDIVALEAEVSRRQADLEALESQLASLKDRVAMAPVVVSLSTSDTPVVDPDDPANAGFLPGLKSGWRAFAGASAALFTVIGAVLPFAAFAALVAIPLWRWRRRQQPRHPADVAEVAPATTPAGA